MKAPRFWDRPPGLASAALAPAAALWRLGAWIRRVRARPAIAGVPVLCVGNLIAGGAGKTPMVAALLTRLAGRGTRAHVVSRGYGGSLRGPLRVDPARHDASGVGDEPLMLAALAPVWVARDRVAGVTEAAKAGAELVILDDGYQNPHLAKDASILMVDAVQGFGNGHLIPAGPLREPVETGLARADLTILVGSPEQREAALRRWPALSGINMIGAEIRPVPTGLSVAGEPVIAFAGIGRPEKFFATLRGLGARVIRAEGFPDHHKYERRVLDRLLRDARATGAMLVTTEKDAVRLPEAFRREVVTLMIRLEPGDWGPLDGLLEKLIATSAP